MNKNLVFSNDEAGETETSDAFSTVGKAGMGDFYIYDIFQSIGTDAAQHLAFEPQATLYWHEK